MTRSFKYHWHKTLERCASKAYCYILKDWHKLPQLGAHMCDGKFLFPSESDEYKAHWAVMIKQSQPDCWRTGAQQLQSHYKLEHTTMHINEKQHNCSIYIDHIHWENNIHMYMYDICLFSKTNKMCICMYIFCHSSHTPGCCTATPRSNTDARNFYI